MDWPGVFIGIQSTKCYFQSQTLNSLKYSVFSPSVAIVSLVGGNNSIVHMSTISQNSKVYSAEVDILPGYLAIFLLEFVVQI